jgi:hypothetical protein
LSGKWKILREVVLLWGFLGCDHQDALHKENDYASGSDYSSSSQPDRTIRSNAK